jgi:hypothetical protein
MPEVDGVGEDEDLAWCSVGAGRNVARADRFRRRGEDEREWPLPDRKGPFAI